MIVDGLLEHLEPLLVARPAVAEDVLVQVLAGADAEEEPARHERGARRRSLRDDRGMDPDQRARDARCPPRASASPVRVAPIVLQTNGLSP